MKMRHPGRHIVLAALLAAVFLSAAVADAETRFVPSRTRRAPVTRKQPLHAILIQGVKYSADWSLDKAEKIKDFFMEKFGHALPVSAMGQTETHDRLKFDHHDALDVALQPDSKEGRALIGYLRESGIPFIAFRRKLTGAATGPHIHIGNPSHRLEAAPLEGDAAETTVALLPEAME
jgi:hypothetical protein